LDLDRLANYELTPLESTDPELAYLFRHLITHEVAYESLTYATREALHEQYARFLEDRLGDKIEAYLDVLAYHYERSENLPKKCEYLLKAGAAAQARYANESALGYYQRVLPLLPPEQQVGARLKAGQVLELTGKWPEASAEYQKVVEQAQQLGDRLTLARCQTIMGELARKGGRFADANHLLEEASLTFKEFSDDDGIAQTLHYRGTVASMQGEYETARKLYEESMALREKQGDKVHIASLLSNLGIVARCQGDYQKARTLHEQSLSLRREVGDKWAIGVSLNNLGNVAIDQGKYEEARILHEEGLAVRREVGDMWAESNALSNLGNLARLQQKYEEARARFGQSLKIFIELDDHWSIAYLLEDMSCLAAVQNQPVRALRLVSAATKLRESIGAPLSEADQKTLDGVLAQARQALDEADQIKAAEDGRDMNLQQLALYALETS